MEKIDVLFIAFVIFGIIVSCYIIYLNTGIKFLLEKVAECRNDLYELVKIQQNIATSQNKINKAQDKINTHQSSFNNNISKFVDIVNKEIFPTGGVE